MDKKERIDVTKLTLFQLQELLERQISILKNKKLILVLKDRGEAVKKLHDKINKEVDHRLAVNKIEESIKSLTLDEPKSNMSENDEFLKEKHVKFVCSLEKKEETARYKPHKTLLKEKAPPQETNKKDTTSAYEPRLKNEPTKLVPLSESLAIENEHFYKILEEKAKQSLGSLLDDVNDEDTSSSDENEEEILVDR